MPENFLHYIWMNRLYYPIGIQSDGGENVEIINPGQRNSDAGPDFFNAQIKIGDTLWAGNVEIHTTSDEWYSHRHEHDAAYDNVILHVVGESTGREIVTSKGRRVPEIALKYPQDIVDRYENINLAHEQIKCGRYLKGLDKMTRDAWIDRLLTERFEDRNERVERLLEEHEGDWEQVFFSLIARAMGFKVNAEPMEHLARITPVKILIKHNDTLQTEALLIGQAGMLPKEAEDEYTKELKREYEFLKSKFGLTPMDASEWKLLRLRPVNFPIIRLSQLAAIVRKTLGNFENVFKTLDIDNLMDTLDVSASEYWDTHYALGKETARKTKSLGKASRRLVVINAIIPYLFSHARRYGKEREQTNIMKMLSFIPMEKNSQIEQWQSLGIDPLHEGEAQALLLLHKKYCMKGKCLTCRFGHWVLSEKS